MTYERFILVMDGLTTLLLAAAFVVALVRLWRFPRPASYLLAAILGLCIFLGENTFLQWKGAIPYAAELEELLMPLIPTAWLFLFVLELQRVDRDRLNNAKATLESRVKERTAELQAANTQLIGEIAARQRAEDDLIKQRDRLEEVVQERTRELLQSNRDLEQFASVASHDLQEPLRNVQGYLQLLESRYKDHLDANAHDFIGFAVEGSTRMSNLISDLLAYSRVGTQAQRLEPTDCNGVLDRALANLHRIKDDTNALITHDPLPVVEADAAQLVQLFQNLIGNALKFRGDRRPEVHVSAHQVDGRWQFSVKDKGIGIPQDQLERIFVIFQRLHLRDEYPGTGIGLAVCKRIMERHGGRIWAESEPGKGSTFHFTI